MAINFPDSPTTGDTHTVGPVTWEWDGSTWKSQGTQEVLSATSPLSYDGDTKVVSVDLSSYYTSAETDSAVATALTPYYTSAQTDSAVSTAISNLVDTAPTTLDTLNELATALGDDPNFATTVATQIGSKADSVHTHAISDVANLQTELDGKLSSLPSGTMKLLYHDYAAINISQFSQGNSQQFTISPSVSTSNPVLIEVMGTISFISGQSDLLLKLEIDSGSLNSNSILFAQYQQEEGSFNYVTQTSGGNAIYLPNGISASSWWLRYAQGNKDIETVTGYITYKIIELIP